MEDPLSLDAQKDSELILVDVPSCKGWGYDAETLKGGKKQEMVMPAAPLVRPAI